MVQPCRVTAGGEHEYRLVKYLMSNYEKSVRPARNPAEPLVVKFDVSIHQIIDVDEKNQGRKEGMAHVVQGKTFVPKLGTISPTQ